MRTPTKWIVAGGAAALVITPVAAVYGSPTIDGELDQSGLVVDAEAANRARAARVTPTAATPTPAATAPADTGVGSAAKPGPSVQAGATAKPSPTAKSSKRSEPSGKKTVSAASPISPKSPKSPDTPG